MSSTSSAQNIAGRFHSGLFLIAMAPALVAAQLACHALVLAFGLHKKPSYAPACMRCRVWCQNGKNVASLHEIVSLVPNLASKRLFLRF